MLTSSRTTLFLSLVTVFEVIAVFSNTAHGQSRSLYMPVLTTSGTDSLLTVTNPSLETVTITLTARSYGGGVLAGSGIINPVSITLPASSTKAVKANELFGQGGLSGWGELQTTSPA